MPNTHLVDPTTEAGMSASRASHRNPHKPSLGSSFNPSDRVSRRHSQHEESSLYTTYTPTDHRFNPDRSELIDLGNWAAELRHRGRSLDSAIEIQSSADSPMRLDQHRRRVVSQTQYRAMASYPRDFVDNSHIPKRRGRDSDAAMNGHSVRIVIFRWVWEICLESLSILGRALKRILPWVLIVSLGMWAYRSRILSTTTSLLASSSSSTFGRGFDPFLSYHEHRIAFPPSGSAQQFTKTFEDVEMAFNSTTELVYLPHKVAAMILDMRDIRVELKSANVMNNEEILHELNIFIESSQTTKDDLSDFNHRLMRALNRILRTTDETVQDLAFPGRDGSDGDRYGQHWGLWFYSLFVSAERGWVALSAVKTMESLHSMSDEIRQLLSTIQNLRFELRRMVQSLESALALGIQQSGLWRKQFSRQRRQLSWGQSLLYGVGMWIPEELEPLLNDGQSLASLISYSKNLLLVLDVAADRLSKAEGQMGDLREAIREQEKLGWASVDRRILNSTVTSIKVAVERLGHVRERRRDKEARFSEEIHRHLEPKMKEEMRRMRKQGG